MVNNQYNQVWGYACSSSSAVPANPNGSPNIWTNVNVNPSNLGGQGYYGNAIAVHAAPIYASATVSDEVLREMLIKKFEATEYEAQKYWDNLFFNSRFVLKGKVPIGGITHPLTMWANENPISFDWRIETEQISQRVWEFDQVYTTPARHKFLDHNFLDNNSFVIPFDPMIRRPVCLDFDEPLISWYTGFVVEKSQIQVIS